MYIHNVDSTVKKQSLGIIPLDQVYKIKLISGHHLQKNVENHSKRKYKIIILPTYNAWQKATLQQIGGTGETIIARSLNVQNIYIWNYRKFYTQIQLKLQNPTTDEEITILLKHLYTHDC